MTKKKGNICCSFPSMNIWTFYMLCSTPKHDSKAKQNARGEPSRWLEISAQPGKDQRWMQGVVVSDKLVATSLLTFCSFFFACNQFLLVVSLYTMLSSKRWNKMMLAVRVIYIQNDDITFHWREEAEFGSSTSVSLASSFFHPLSFSRQFCSLLLKHLVKDRWQAATEE